jgi:transposase
VDQVDSFRLDHLGIVAQMAENIGLADAVDDLTGTDPREVLSSGQAVVAMALNCLGYTSRPLYISPDFFRPRHVHFLLGKSKTQPETQLGPEHLNQHKLGRVLDAIADLGPERVFTEVAIRAFRAEGVAVPNCHCDTTTHSFEGEFEDEKGRPLQGELGDDDGDEEPVTITITHGYSKDHRADCKQVVQELLVSSDGDVPLMFKAWSGNASDVIVMQERIRKLKGELLKADAQDLFPRYFVGDSKLYSQKALEDARADGVHWISRVPETVSEVDDCVEQALAGRGFWLRSTDEELTEGLSYQQFLVTKWNIPQRFIVVRTDASKARTKASVERRVEKERESLEKAGKKLTKTAFACEPDLRSAFQKLFAKAQFHELGDIVVRSESRKRGRGRPRAGEESADIYFLQSFRIRKSVSEARRAILEGACFVIGTNDVSQETSPEEILKVYMKDQQGVERGFRFLKDPAYFADAFFLKSPRRVAALLCVMTIALLLYSLAQRRLRMELKANKMTVPNQLGKPTRTPTLRWVNQQFEGVDVTRLRNSGTTRLVFHRLEEFEKNVLAALGGKYQARYSEIFVT